MNKETTKRFYIIHSWVGILTAVLLFVICFTGAISVFGRPELKIWGDVGLRGFEPIEPEVLESLVREHLNEVPPNYHEEIFIQFPGVRGANKLVIGFETHVKNERGRIEHHLIRFIHQPKTLALIERDEGTVRELSQKSKQDISTFLVTFHADLHLGNPLGLLITGLLGLTLFASIVTGVLIHRKMLKEAFKFRPWRSFRLLFTDSHKALGVWGLLFHATIAFTGAFLGLAVVLLLKAAAFVSFSGDVGKLSDTFLPEYKPEPSGIVSELTFSEILRHVEESDAGKITFVSVRAPTDANAMVLINTAPGRYITSKVQRFRARDAQLMEEYTTYSRVGGVSGPMLDAMLPLHFGNFGGLGVKFLWFTLGMSTALLSITGAMIWVERRCYGSEGQLSEKQYDRIARFSSGICAGLVLATALLFHCQLLFVYLNNENPGAWLGWVFFASWLGATFYSGFRGSSYVLVKELLLLAGLCFVLVAPMNGLLTGDHLLNVFQRGHWTTAGVDLCLLVLGLAISWLALRLPKKRPVRANKRRSVPLTSELAT